MTRHKHYIGGGGAGENSPPAVAGEHPRNPYYADLVAKAHRQWAVAVAENLVWLAGRPHSLHTVNECWIDIGLALCLRYSNTAGRFAARFAHLEVSPITGPLSPTLREHDSGSAAQQASDFSPSDSAAGLRSAGSGPTPMAGDGGVMLPSMAGRVCWTHAIGSPPSRCRRHHNRIHERLLVRRSNLARFRVSTPAQP